jgi:hypothetical protein
MEGRSDEMEHEVQTSLSLRNYSWNYYKYKLTIRVKYILK